MLYLHEVSEDAASAFRVEFARAVYDPARSPAFHSHELWQLCDQHQLQDVACFQSVLNLLGGSCELIPLWNRFTALSIHDSVKVAVSDICGRPHWTRVCVWIKATLRLTIVHHLLAFGTCPSPHQCFITPASFWQVLLGILNINLAVFC